MPRVKRESPEDESGVTGGGPLPEHPLFPLEEGQKPFQVSYIGLARRENGAMKYIPGTFRAEELFSEKDIIERFGGGDYELYARAESKHHVGQPGYITKRRLLSLPGNPKPLDPNNASPAEKQAAGLGPKPENGGGALGGDSSILIAILQMSQSQAAQAAQQSQNFMALMMQMMNESRKDASVTSANMMQMFSQMSSSNQQTMMQLLPLMIQQKGGGPEELAKYVDMMKSLGLAKVASDVAGEGGTPANESIGAILENVADIVAGAPGMLGALKQLTGPAPMPTGNSPIEQRSIAAARVPGSAASVLLGGGKPPGT